MTGRQRRARAAALLASALLPAAAAGAQPPASPLDITTYPVVWTVPAMADTKVRFGLSAEVEGSAPVPFEITYPRTPRRGERYSFVVFANTTGADFRTWRIYTDWARLVAAHGLAGVVYQSDAANPEGSLRVLVEQLRAHGAELKLDAESWAVWACSANVTLALPYLMGETPPGLRGAVLYYGATTVPRLRTDLPVHYVLAEHDAPHLNESIRSLWAEAARTGAPWTMVVASGLPHAFDALVESGAARRRVRDTVAFLTGVLSPDAAVAPEADAARSALIALYGHQPAAAAEALARLITSEPRDGEARRLLALSLVRAGRAAEAVATLREALAIEPDRADLREALGRTLLETGDAAAAAPELERALEGDLPAPRRANALYNLACAYARTGRLDEALARLEAALAAGFADRALLATDPDLAPLRDDPRFAALLARLPAR
jgi:tetratricopeptide (TPR) repeat protein